MSPPTTGHQRGQKRRRVSVGKRFCPIFVWTRRLGVVQGMSVLKRFHANIRISDTLMVNLEWNMTRKLDPRLEPSNYKQIPRIRMLHRKFDMSTTFHKRWTWIFAHVVHVCPSRDLTSGRWFFFRWVHLVVLCTYVYVHMWRYGLGRPIITPKIDNCPVFVLLGWRFVFWIIMKWGGREPHIVRCHHGSCGINKAASLSITSPRF